MGKGSTSSLVNQYKQHFERTEQITLKVRFQEEGDDVDADINSEGDAECDLNTVQKQPLKNGYAIVRRSTDKQIEVDYKSLSSIPNTQRQDSNTQSKPKSVYNKK